MSEDQGWTEVVAKPKKIKQKQPESDNKPINNLKQKSTNVPIQDKKYNSGRNVQSIQTNARKIEKNADSEDVISVQKLTHNFTLQLQQARQQKQLTQKQLANLCQLPETKIRDYENGNALPNQQDINKMSKELGVILKNK